MLLLVLMTSSPCGTINWILLSAVLVWDHIPDGLHHLDWSVTLYITNMIS